MLNPFPIQFLAMFAYFLLRFFVGAILIYLGLSHYKNRRELKEIFTLSWFPYGAFSVSVFFLSELLIGSLILLGAHTQYAALAVMLMSIKMLIMRNWFSHSSIPSKIFYLLLFATAISLFITGAGTLAFDLPI